MKPTQRERDEHERGYIEGQRSAVREQLRAALRELNMIEDEVSLEQRYSRMVLEREAAIAALRRVCDDYGDNDWTEKQHLADIIEKHLHRHLDDNAPDSVRDRDE